MRKTNIKKKGELIDELREQVNFLMNNDRTAVRIYIKLREFSVVCEIRAQYIYNNKLHDCKLATAMLGTAQSVIENTLSYAIIQFQRFGYCTYYKLDKANCVAVNVTAEYSKLAEIEKSENEPTLKKKKATTKKTKAVSK